MQRSWHERGAFSGGAAIGPVIFVLFILLLIIGAPTVVIATEVVSPVMSAAGEEEETDSADNVSEDSASIPTLPPLVVTGSLFDLIPSSATLTQKQIESLPSRNGTLTEILPLLPGIQASDLRSPSDRGGEIEAPELSISGAAFYQNTYRIDGVAIDSKLDPVANNPNDANNFPGQSTNISVSTRLVESVTVYDHGVPARYGNFIGGVIDVTSRSPGSQPGGAIHLRTTRDDWTRFHIAPEKEESFNASRTYEQQPEFIKYDVGGEVEVPLPGGSGALASVQTVSSDIRLNYFDGHKSQTRSTDQYFLKWRGNLTHRDDLSLSFNATPQRNTYYLANTKDSDFTIGLNSYQYILNWIHTYPFATVTTTGGFGKSESFRDSPDHYRVWQPIGSKSWGANYGAYSIEGGYGDLEKEQRSMQLGTHWEFQSLSGGPLQNRLNAGFELKRSDANFERPKTSYMYSRAIADSTVDCDRDTEACIDKEQYMTRRNVYSAGFSSVRIDEGSLYLEDNMVLGTLELRPGARLSYDDYTRNSNLAPRFFAAWDILGGKSTVLFFGLNRYYGQVLPIDTLRTMLQPMVTENRTSISGTWTVSPTQTYSFNNSADLKTPYNDEISAGVDQAFLGGRLKLDYIYRKGYDEVASEVSDFQNKIRYRTFNNNGRSHYESWRSSWNRSWSSGELLFNLTRAESQTSIDSYDTLLDETLMARRIMYNGELINKDEVPRSDYNRTWTGNFSWLQHLPAGFDFTNVTSYRSGYHAIEDTYKNLKLFPGTTEEEEVDIYAEVKHGQSWIFDWVLAWNAPQVAGVETRFVAEILNVFNSKVELGESSERYEQGRQFWAGLEGKF